MTKTKSATPPVERPETFATGDTCTDRDGRTWAWVGEPESPQEFWTLDSEELLMRDTQGLVDEFSPITWG